MLRQLDSGHVVWQLEDGTRGSFAPSVLELFKAWKQERIWSKEAGGLLLGFIDQETGGLLVEGATVPGKGDRRSRYGFFRCNRHQQEAERWNRNTDGHGTQMGLWHTHPEAVPRPSSVDLEDYRNVMRHGQLSSDGLIYLIVGTKQVVCWYGRPNQQLMDIGSFSI